MRFSTHLQICCSCSCICRSIDDRISVPHGMVYALDAFEQSAAGSMYGVLLMGKQLQVRPVHTYKTAQTSLLQDIDMQSVSSWQTDKTIYSFHEGFYLASNCCGSRSVL